MNGKKKNFKPETLNKFYLIEKYVKNVKSYPLEMKMAGRLLDLFPDINFWKVMANLELQSLCQINTKASLSFLSKQYRLFILKMPLSPVFQLEDEKIGVNINTNTKPATIKEFLKI